MKINLDDLMPWAAVNTHFTRMKKLRVTINGEDMGKECVLSVDGHGTLTLAFEKDEPKSRTKVKRFDDVFDDVYDPMSDTFPGKAN